MNLMSLNCSGLTASEWHSKSAVQKRVCFLRFSLISIIYPGWDQL